MFELIYFTIFHWIGQLIINLTKFDCGSDQKTKLSYLPISWTILKLNIDKNCE